MIIGIGSDHAGFRYKEHLKDWLHRAGHQVQDFGAESDAPVDYPRLIRPVAQAVASGVVERGIVLGGSGNGEAIVSNRIPGVRCAYCWNEESARLGREHNDANMVAIGERLVPIEVAQRIVEIFLNTPFSGGRHARRIRMIDTPEE